MLSFRFRGRLLTSAFLLFAATVIAQSPAPRLNREILGGGQMVLTGSRSPLAVSATAKDIGPLSGNTPVRGLTLVLGRSPAQEHDLHSLMAAQLDVASPQFHKWLTPEQFAARFGINDGDLAKIQRWIENRGFEVESIDRGRDRITFSGTADQVASAFGTSLHRYRTPAGVHFGPASELSLPSDLAPLVTAVLHLSDLRPKTPVRLRAALPEYTTAQNQDHYLDPLDVAVQYDIDPLYNAGVRGSGQTIAIVGQSWVNPEDYNSFVLALGLGSLRGPSLVLVPNSGVAAAVSDDEVESDIDLEYSSATAPGADMVFVYVGDNLNYNVFDALRYAVTEDVAPIISISYGSCEQDLGSSELNELTQITEQANVQGQTVIAAAGDSGSNGCFYDAALSSSQQQALSVTVPASLSNVTSVGGLQMAPGTFSAGNSLYFASASGTDNVASLQSYVPEVVWNEDSSSHGRLAGGGGVSTLVSRPAWQTGVPGIPSGSFRLVPDIALQSSVFSPGYVFCTSDMSAFSANQVNSCYNSTLLDSVNNSVTIAGGTSFAAPIFAGMLALLNQAIHAAGQGNVNEVLYQLAASPSTFSSAFHDITTGGNQCNLGAGSCSSAAQTSYAATSGYDQASGLGSIDLANLVAAWPSSTSTLDPTQTQVGLGSFTQGAGSSQLTSISVTTQGLIVPTGTVKVLLDGTVLEAAAPISAGQVQVTYTAPTVSGSHVITGIYSGDAHTAPSTGSASFDVGTLSATGGFNLSASNVNLPANGSGTGIITVTPSGGYTGLVSFSLGASASSPSLCYRLGQASTYKGTTATVTLTLGTGAACTTALAVSRDTSGRVRSLTANKDARSIPLSSKSPLTAPVALANLLILTFFARRRRLRLGSTVAVAILVCFCFVSNGCGGGGSSSASGSSPAPPTPAQTLTLTVNATDSINPSIASSTTFTVTVGR